MRDYGAEGQIGLEPTPEEHIERLVEVFREVRRVLRSDGALWVNYGDAYESGTRASRDYSKTTKHGYWNNPNISFRVSAGLKPKDLIGLPWMLAFALRADGWWLRSDVIWSKPNALPESVTDRPTKAHEYLFLLSKNDRYFYDADAIREPHAEKSFTVHTTLRKGDGVESRGEKFNKHFDDTGNGRQLNPAGRNKRTVWEIATPKVRLRDDLTPDQRRYVLGELLRRGLL